MTARMRAMLVLPMTALFLIGCNSSPEDVRIPVEGTVFLGDKPATNGAVIFRPDATKGNTSQHEPRGKIEAEGKFHIQTTLQKGGPLGWYKVGVVVTEPSDPKAPYAVPKSLIAKKYNDPDSSGIAFEIKGPKSDPCVIKLDPKAGAAP